MTTAASEPKLAYPQRARLQRFNIEQSVDIHCHVLPGVDDGPATMDDALALCRALVRDGITTAIATPHQLGRLEGQNQPVEIRRRVQDLQAVVDERRIPLRIQAGGEVRVDERIPKLLRDDAICALGEAKKYLLLELPSAMAVNAATLLERLELAGLGVFVILAHAERCEALVNDPPVAEQWVQKGVALQVNAGGLLGTFGAASAAAALEWLRRGWVSLIASDAHSVGTRRPRITDAIEFIVEHFGEQSARRVCLENPLRVLQGQPLLE